MSYFPDGQRTISGSGGKTTRQWDLKVEKEIEESQYICENDEYVVCAVTISRDGRWVVDDALMRECRRQCETESLKREL
ncbi:hypothetical protein BDR04DRAFT_1094864 [Suillus decipiens]|nr:hypothetical protein BDR04DRAFT_1094864 [Suillus decipiens]